MMASTKHLLGTLSRYICMWGGLSRNDTPVVQAVRSDNVMDLQRLLQEGHLLSEKDDDNNSLLHIAANFKSVSVVDFLLTRGVIDVNGRNREGWTALFLAAAFSRSLPVVEKLLSAGADVSLPDRLKITVLDYLLNCPGDPTLRDNTPPVAITRRLLGRVPDSGLYVAALSDPQILSALIRDGADVNAQHISGIAPLHLAVLTGQEASMEVLLDAGADVDATNMLGWATLRQTPDEHHSIARRLIAAGADLELKDSEGHTVLHIAVRRNRHERVSLLVEAGANVRCRNKKRRTPLHEAVSNRSGDGAPLALLLVGRGADVDAVDSEGSTPLHVAAQTGDLEGAALLLYHGAEPHRISGHGYTPFMLALMCRHDSVQELLLEYEYDFNRRSYEGDSLLTMAFDGDSPIMWEIIRRGGVFAIDTSKDEDEDKSEQYEVICERLGLENFPAGEHDNVLGFAIHYGRDSLFRYAMESSELPVILEDAYARRSQGLLTDQNPFYRTDCYPAIDGLLEFVLGNFDYEEAANFTYILLSRGYEPDYREAYEFSMRYGWCPIFDFLLDMDLRPCVIPKDCLLPNVILDVTHSVRQHVDYLRQHLKMWFQYYEHEVFREKLSECSQKFRVPQGLDRTVPSLQELSRDSVRDSICSRQDVTSYGDFRRHVRSLHAGALWKVIMFRKPLY